MSLGKQKAMTDESDKQDKRLIFGWRCDSIMILRGNHKFGLFFWLLRENIYRYIMRLSAWTKFVMINLAGLSLNTGIQAFFYDLNPARRLCYA